MNKKFGYNWLEQLRDNDEISDEEEGFMLGYEGEFEE
tara:strand:+ start:461 stop:571 length:111 start_codon:yes stop_codon:yes gene_type:complete